MQQFPNGGFVRLSTRSPKDAVFSIRGGIKVKQLVKQYYTSPENSMHAFVKSIQKAMKVTCAKEAIELLVHSKRMVEDIVMAKLFMDESNPWNLQLVLREWSDDLDASFEFRAFVFDNQFTACTQYNSLCAVPAMIANREIISKNIQHYFATIVQPILVQQKLQTYTIDFAVNPNDFSQIKIIELNYPPPEAGQALFDWENAKDKHIIEKGPYEFRILEKQSEKAYDEIHPPIALYIRALDDEYKQAHASSTCTVM